VGPHDDPIAISLQIAALVVGTQVLLVSGGVPGRCDCEHLSVRDNPRWVRFRNRVDARIELAIAADIAVG
jgi:hypothetical protein